MLRAYFLSFYSKGGLHLLYSSIHFHHVATRVSRQFSLGVPPSILSGTSSANVPGFSIFLASQFLFTWSIAVNAISHLSVRMLYAGITPSFRSV